MKRMPNCRGYSISGRAQFTPRSLLEVFSLFLEDLEADHHEEDIDGDSDEGRENVLLGEEHHRYDWGEDKQGHPEGGANDDRVIAHRNGL